MTGIEMSVSCVMGQAYTLHKLLLGNIAKDAVTFGDAEATAALRQSEELMVEASRNTATGRHGGATLRPTMVHELQLPLPPEVHPDEESGVPHVSPTPAQSYGFAGLV